MLAAAQTPSYRQVGNPLPPPPDVYLPAIASSVCSRAQVVHQQMWV